MIVRIALANNPKGWEEGTVLDVYPDNVMLNWGDEASWLLIKVPTPFTSGLERLKTKIVLDFLSEDSKEAYKKNKKYHSEHSFDEHGRKPRFDKVVTKPTILPTNEDQWPRPDNVPFEEPYESKEEVIEEEPLDTPN